MKFVWWDHRDQIDIDELNRAILAVFHPSDTLYQAPRVPCVSNVNDTGSDEIVVVVSGEQITVEQAQKIYDDCYGDRYAKDVINVSI